MPFEDSAFDLVWSLESGEHMPDKKKFVNELMRVVAPGGRIIIVTWCHRDLERGEPSLSRKEEKMRYRWRSPTNARGRDTELPWTSCRASTEGVVEPSKRSTKSTFFLEARISRWRKA